MKQKTRLLVLNSHLNFLSQCDRVVVMGSHLSYHNESENVQNNNDKNNDDRSSANSPSSVVCEALGIMSLSEWLLVDPENKEISPSVLKGSQILKSLLQGHTPIQRVKKEDMNVIRSSLNSNSKERKKELQKEALEKGKSKRIEAFNNSSETRAEIIFPESEECESEAVLSRPVIFHDETKNEDDSFSSDNSESPKPCDSIQVIPAASGILIQKEQREKGSVKWRNYVSFFF
jgi:hypothetical protein